MVSTTYQDAFHATAAESVQSRFSVTTAVFVRVRIIRWGQNVTIVLMATGVFPRRLVQVSVGVCGCAWVCMGVVILPVLES